MTAPFIKALVSMFQSVFQSSNPKVPQLAQENNGASTNIQPIPKVENMAVVQANIVWFMASRHNQKLASITEG